VRPGGAADGTDGGSAHSRIYAAAAAHPAARRPRAGV